jgi:hypothetical protein
MRSAVPSLQAAAKARGHLLGGPTDEVADQEINLLDYEKLLHFDNADASVKHQHSIRVPAAASLSTSVYIYYILLVIL